MLSLRKLGENIRRESQDSPYDKISSFNAYLPLWFSTKLGRNDVKRRRCEQGIPLAHFARFPPFTRETRDAQGFSLGAYKTYVSKKNGLGSDMRRIYVVLPFDATVFYPNFITLRAV